MGEITKYKRMTKVNRTHKLSFSRQCELQDVFHSSFYYSPNKNSSYNDELMKLIDKQYIITPSYEVPAMAAYLQAQDHEVNLERFADYA
jgi:putative transposase